MSRRPPSFLARHGTVVLVLLGALLLAASLLQPAGRTAFSIALVVFGSALAVLGVALPRLLNAEVGPATGLKLTLAEERDERDVSTRLAEVERVSKVDASQVVAATRLVLASDTLAGLLAPEHGPLAGVFFHLYLFDEERRLLLPAFEGRPSPSRGWAVGTGAVGEAWASAEYVLARGAEVSDDTYGLTAAQQRRARDLSMVAAMPVANASGAVLAVLAGSSIDPASPLGTADGFDAHLLMAQVVARVLVDLLKWFSD